MTPEGRFPDEVRLLDKLEGMSQEPVSPAVDRALGVLEEAQSLEGPQRADAFERFHDALAAALDEEPEG